VQSRIDTPETQRTLDTQNIGRKQTPHRKQKVQSKIDTPETQRTLDTQNIGRKQTPHRKQKYEQHGPNQESKAEPMCSRMISISCLL